MRRLDTLSLVGINNMALKVSPAALALNEQLQVQGAADALHFAKLATAAKARKDAPVPKVKVASNWAGRLETMRTMHPNAFKPWKAEDDVRLKQMHGQGLGLESLARALGRQPGSITARLKKHFGDEVEVKA